MIREHSADALGAVGWPDGACLFLSTCHTRGGRVREDDGVVAETVSFHVFAKVGACMSPLYLRLYIAASATSLVLLAFIVAGTSQSPSAVLLAVIGLVPPIIMPLWTSRRDSRSGRC